MATNSDGGIVLSVSIDSSEVSSDMKKVVSEINKEIQGNAKNLKAVESVNQAKEKTAQYQAKTNQEVYKEVEAEYKALTAEQNLNTAKEKGAIVSAKKVVEEEKGYQALVKSEIAENNLQQSQNATLISEQKLTTEKEKGYQATLQSQIKEQELAQEIENSATAEAKKQKAMLDAQKKQQDLLIGEQKLKKATEDAATAQEKHKQEIIKTEKAQNSLKNATNSVTTAIKKMATQLGIVFSIRQIINFSNEASELASQTESYLVRLNMLYGESAQKVYDWVNANASALGMAKSAAYEAAADYGNLLTTSVSAAESAELSIELMQATAVMASQTGRTYEETMEKIRSGIYGNTRAIDDLGVSVRQNSLEMTQAWQKVSQNGTKSWNDLTDAQLQYLRVLGIIEQSTDHYGSEVIQTTSLVRTQFNVAWQDFKATFGQLINRYLIPAMQKITKLLNYVTVFLKVIFDLDVSVSNLSTLQGELNDQTEEYDTIVKKATKSLASFDEIIKLSNDSIDSFTSSGNLNKNIDTTYSVSSTVSSATIPTEDIEKLKEFENWLIENKSKITTALETAGVIALGASIASLIEKIDELLPKFGKKDDELDNQTKKTNKESSAVKVLCGAFAGASLLAWGVSKALNGLTGGAEETEPALGAVTSQAEGMATSFRLAKDESAELEKSLDSLSRVTIPVAENSNEAANKAFSFAENNSALNYSLQELNPKLVDIAEKHKNVAVEERKNSNNAVEVKNKNGELKSALDDTLLSLEDCIPLYARLREKTDESTSSTKEMTLKQKAAVWAFEDAKKNGISPLNAALIIWNSNLKKTLKNQSEFTTDSSKNISEWGQNTSVNVNDTAANWFVSIATSTEEGAKAIDDFVSNSKSSQGIQTRKNVIKGAITAIASGIFAYFTGGMSSLLPIPALAQGAVIPANREFLAVLGDQKYGTNIEAPAELIKQMALEALVEYQAAMPQQGTDITIRFEGTESQLFKYLVPRIDKYNNHRGTNLLTQRQV